MEKVLNSAALLLFPSLNHHHKSHFKHVIVMWKNFVHPFFSWACAGTPAEINVKKE